MSQTWRVVETHGEREWSGKNGDFVDYYLTVAGYDERVVLTQKPETRPPLTDHELYGYITVLERHKRDGTPFEVHKLKKEQQPDNGQAPVQSGTAHTFAPAHDSRGARIERQHSQEMAIRVLNVMPEIQVEGGAHAKQLLRHWTDHFCEDLDAYERARFLPKTEPTATKGGVDSGQGGASRPVAQTPKLAELETLEDEVLAGGVADDDQIPF